MPRSGRPRFLCLLLGSILSAVSLGGRPAAADVVAHPPPPPRPAVITPTPATRTSIAQTSTTAAPAPTAAQPAAPAVPGLPSPDDLPPDVPEELRQILGIAWRGGPAHGALGDIADVQVPEGLMFTDGEGTRRFLEINHNPTRGSELGMIAAQDLSWFLIFQFSDIGFVDDDDRGKLDAAAILESLRQSSMQSNERRRERGWGTVTLVGWAEPPRYDPATHHLEWATRGQDDQNKSVIINHDIRLLGRRGVMETSLLVPQDTYAAALPATRKLLEGLHFRLGERYTEVQPGDAIAEVGLVGLMTGHAAATAEPGLLQKHEIAILALLGAVAAGISLTRLRSR